MYPGSLEVVDGEDWFCSGDATRRATGILRELYYQEDKQI